MSNKQILCLLLTCGAAVLLSAQNAARSTPAPKAAAVQVAAYYFPAWHKDTVFPGANGEWPSLQKATARFPGHRQPKVPLWGYQDESDPAVMAQKINAAVDNHVSVFLFDWYWRDGGPMLEDALDKGFLKASNRARIKFALMWDNHAAGTVGRAKFEAMTDHIVRDLFSSSSYWKVDGRSYFSIYHLGDFIRDLGGIEQAQAALQSFSKKAADAGFGGVYLNVIDWGIPKEPPGVVKLLGGDSVTSYVWVHKIHLDTFPKTDYALLRDRYFEYWDAHKNDYGVPYFPNATTGWDPTPRIPADKPYDGKSAYPNTPVLWDNSPVKFKSALESARTRALTLPPGERIVTIYAWNEWTEGGNLEPDTDSKMSYLQAVHDVFATRP